MSNNTTRLNAGEERPSLAKTLNQSLGTLHGLVEKYNNAAKDDSEDSFKKAPSGFQHPSSHKYL